MSEAAVTAITAPSLINDGHDEKGRQLYSTCLQQLQLFFFASLVWLGLAFVRAGRFGGTSIQVPREEIACLIRLGVK